MFIAHYGPVLLNKASDEEKAAATQTLDLSKQLNQDYTNEFGSAQQIQGALGARLNQLYTQGESGQGFLPGEEADLRTDARENAAQTGAQAQQALGETLAARGNGSDATSGNIASQAERIATGTAAENANAQRGITEQNAQLARANVSNALSGEGSLAGQESTLAGNLGSEADSANGQNFNEQTQAYQPSGVWGDLAGGLLSMVPYVGPAVGKFASNAINGPDQAQAQQVLGTALSNGNAYTASLNPTEEDDTGDIESS